MFASSSSGAGVGVGAESSSASRQKPLNVVLKELLKKFRRKDRTHLFWEAVPRSTPGYYESITTPMDFSLMEAKMKKNRYATLEEFAADYGLVCSNCKFFNNPQSEYWNQADMMEKYGAGCLEQARDEVDTSVPPNAKWSASGAAAAADDKSNTAMPAAQSYTDLQQLQAAGAGSSGPISYGLPKPGSRAAQIASSSLLFEASAFQNQNAFNPHLYPTIPPGMVAQQGGFTHPGSLPESKDYWAAAPYPPYHPQSQLGLAFSANLSNNLQAGGAGAGGQQMKGKLKNAWQQRPPAAKMVKRDIRLLSGPGVENNFGLPAVSGAATVMDWITLWEREQEVWKQTGRNAVVREEQDGYNSLGPLSYADYKPSASHLNFDGRYLDRIVKFVRQGVVGDAAQVIPTSAATQVHLPNPSTTASLYTHLLKDSCIHRALASKIDGIQTDPLQQQMKAGPKDYVPTALATALPKAHPVALKTGEPMGISVNDVQNIRSLMQELEGMMKAAFALKQQQAAAAKAAAAASTLAPPAAAGSSPAISTSPQPIEVDSAAAAPAAGAPAGATAAAAVKEEQGVKMEDVDQPTAPTTQVKQEIQVKQEPVDSGATPMDVSEDAAPAAPAAAVKTEVTSSPIASRPVSLPLPPSWRPPNLVALLPVLPTTRIVSLECALLHPNHPSGSTDTCVRFRFAQPVVQAVGIPNFTPAFLAGTLTQHDILALRGMHGLGEKMVEWHRIKQQMMQQQQIKIRQQQQQQQQQAALAAAAAAASSSGSSSNNKHHASSLPASEEPAAKRAKLDPLNQTQSAQGAGAQGSAAQVQMMQHQHMQQQQMRAAHQQQQQHASMQSSASSVPIAPSGSSLQGSPGGPLNPASSSSSSSTAPSVAPPTGGPSSSPMFDRSRLMPALRSLSGAILDRFIALGFISATGTVLVDAGVIIAKLKDYQPQAKPLQ